MNFKLIQLKYRFLLQIAFFIIYLAMLTGIVFFIQDHLNYKNDPGKVFNKLEGLLSESYISCNEFLSQTSHYDDFYRDGQNQFTIRFQDNLNTFNDTIKLLKINNILFKRERTNLCYDSVTVAAENYGIAFNQLLLSIRELGTTSSGKLGSAHGSFRKIMTHIDRINNKELTRLGLELSNSESEYILASNGSTYYELESVLNEISNLPDLDYEDMQLVEELKAQIENYRTQLINLNTLFSRIGTIAEKTGLKGELVTRYIYLQQFLEKLKDAVHADEQMHRKVMLTVAIIVTILITFIYLLLLFIFSGTIRKPLIDAIQFSMDLSKGKNPEKELDTEIVYEFSLLNRNLNTINNSLLEKRQFVDDLLKQKFKADLNLQGRVDTFGKTLIALKENMRKTRDEQLKHAEENQIRRYQNEGIAKFADILRSNSDNLNKLADVFIKEIVKYLEAIQGGLFLLEKETDKELKLATAFAYNRKKYLQKSIRLGESLVGTCALERKTINLTDIPEDYVEITSGLGDAPPNNLLLLPIMHEQHLIGVLELASLKKFEENAVILGEKIASSLASTIISARINSQTAELLQKSQQQAAEMAEQEEEMRQNMEELKATQEESSRREEELEGILGAIDQAFYVIEYDTEGIIQKVNQRFLYLVNLHADKVLGKKHSQLFGKKSKADELLFANVSEGNTVELNEDVEVNNISLEIKNTFSPIRSKDGKTIKILNILTINH